MTLEEVVVALGVGEGFGAESVGDAQVVGGGGAVKDGAVGEVDGAGFGEVVSAGSWGAGASGG